MRSVGRRILCVFLSALLLGGCSGGEREGVQESPDSSAVQQEMTYTVGKVNLSNAVVGEGMRKDTQLYAEEFFPWDPCEMEEEHRDAVRILGDRMYLMECSFGGGQGKALVTVTDGAGECRERLEVTAESLGAMAGSMIVDMDVRGEGEYAFLTAKLEDPAKPKALGYELFLTDGEGEVQRHTDLTASYLEEGGLAFYGQVQCLVDGAGCSYVGYGSMLLAADETGKSVLRQDFGENGSVGSPVRDGDGILYFPVYDGESLHPRIVFWDARAQELRTLASLPEDVYRLYGIAGSRVYYETEEGVVCWDTTDGERELVFALRENGFDSRTATYLLLAEGKLPVLLVDGREEGWRVLLSAEKPEPGATLQVVSLLGEYEPGKEGAAIASRMNPSCQFSWESYEDESGRDRALAELTAGKGPDILYLSIQDMELLAEKGALLDLGELIGQETLDALFPAALGLGTRDGVLWGVPDEMRVYTLVTTRDIWPEDSWSLADIWKLVQENAGLEGIVAGGERYTPYDLIRALVGMDLAHSPFLDWEKGECRFEEEGFAALLELAKETGTITDPDLSGADAWLAEGRILAVDPAVITRFSLYTYLQQKVGEDCFFVGYPSETGEGNLVSANGVFVVNKNCADRRAAGIYLETLLGESVQKKKENRMESELSVRRLHREPGEWMTPQELRQVGEWQSFQEFLESCVPLEEAPKGLQEIFDQEISDYMDGDYSAAQAAQNLDNRVQLYLDERR